MLFIRPFVTLLGSQTTFSCFRKFCEHFEVSCVACCVGVDRGRICGPVIDSQPDCTLIYLPLETGTDSEAPVPSPLIRDNRCLGGGSFCLRLFCDAK